MNQDIPFPWQLIGCHEERTLMELLINERYREEFLRRFEPKTCWHKVQKYNLQSIIIPSLVIIWTSKLYGQASERYYKLGLYQMQRLLVDCIYVNNGWHVHFQQSVSWSTSYSNIMNDTLIIKYTGVKSSTWDFTCHNDNDEIISIYEKWRETVVGDDTL